MQCFRSPRPGPCPSWRLTTNDHTKNSAMICSLENPTAPFAEEPCRATSEYLEGGRTAGPGQSSDGSRNRVHLFPSGTGRQPTHGGFPALTHQDQVDTDNDSLLLLRFLVILTLAHEGAKAHGASPPASFLEHPEDPAQCSNSPSAHRCSSIWAIEWLRNLLQALGLNLIHFDQCRLGQCTPKPTTLATNLDLRHWEQLRCNHPSHTKPMGTTSSDLSRYPWNMMQGLARAILESDASQGSKPPTPPANKTDRPTTQTHSPKMTLDDNPMRVQLGFRIRPIRDGGGKPSQGRLPPPLRPQSPCGTLCKELAEICEPWVEDFTSSIHSGSKTHPFSIHLLRQLREKLASYCSTTGDPHNVEPGQPFHLDLLADLALSLQDPDWEYPKILREGVPLGVTSPTLRTPDVWPTKEELRGEEDPFPEYPPLQGRDNYPSAKEFTKEIEATFEEEKTMGMVLGPMTQQEAAEICGCQPDQLCPGPMAGIQESDKVRTIFDCSWGGANTHIQSNTIERTTAPTVMDCVQALHWLHASKTTPLAPAQGGEMGRSTTWSPPGPHQAWTLLKADITKAHRRIKVLPTDWRFQIAQLGERSWWINKVGTYGMASAQLYWGRMAALLRITYLIFYEVDWGFVFVDDFCWILRTESANLWATTILATYLALGVPLSWKKTVLSEVNTWLGFVVNPRTLVVRMAQDKHDIIMEILQKLSQGETFTSKAIEKALGRINWATSVCPLSRPFLQPFWAWKTACKSSGKPPKLVCLFAKMLSHIFSVPYHQPSPYLGTSPWWGASDASATKDMATGYPMIGGWISDLEFPDKKAVWWFQITITPEIS